MTSMMDALHCFDKDAVTDGVGLDLLVLCDRATENEVVSFKDLVVSMECEILSAVTVWMTKVAVAVLTRGLMIEILRLAVPRIEALDVSVLEQKAILRSSNSLLLR